MLYIEAKKNNSNLKLKPGKELEIVFNNKGKKDMQLFNGKKTDDDNINWKLEPQLESIEIDELILENDAISFQSVQEAPIYPGCENENDKEKRDCMKAAIDKLVNLKFDTSIGEDLNLTGKYTIKTFFEIDTEGNIGKIEARASQKQLAQEAIRVIELIPKLIPGKQDDKSVKVKYYLPITFMIKNSEVNNQDLRVVIGQRDSMVTVRSDKKFQKEIEEKPISEISKSDLERYTLSTTQLGWINCDRFINSRKNKIRYNINISNAEDANVKLIFKSMSSILPSRASNGFYDFGLVPVNEEVILLGIKKKGDKIFLGLKELRIRATSKQDIDFKEVSLSELKKELIKLNSNF